MPFDPLQEAVEIIGETEFYIFDFGDGEVVEYYTSSYRAVTTDAFTASEVTFKPLPIARKGVDSNHRVQPSKTQIALPIQPSFVSLVAQGGLDAVKLSIIRGFGRDYANDYRNPWFVGFLTDITVSPTKVVGNLKSAEDLFGDPLPAIFHQSGCNNQLYDDVCGVNPNSYVETRTVTDVQESGRLIILDGSIPTNDTFTFGRMRQVQVPETNIWRNITQQAGLQFVLHVPILSLAIGDQVDILPGCGKDVEADCDGRYSNFPNSVAMPNIPKVNPILDGF